MLSPYGTSPFCFWISPLHSLYRLVFPGRMSVKRAHCPGVKRSLYESTAVGAERSRGIVWYYEGYKYVHDKQGGCAIGRICKNNGLNALFWIFHKQSDMQCEIFWNILFSKSQRYEETCCRLKCIRDCYMENKNKFLNEIEMWIKINTIHKLKHNKYVMK